MSELVQPLEWDQEEGGGWHVLVRCPECFRLSRLRLTAQQARKFRGTMEEAAHSLESTADMLDLQVFRETYIGFVQALRDGLVWPMDF
ncbi:MAG: epoxyqueuosine reductase QueH [Gaiellales bacterium]|nr:epoxyqueuosine reductase QueH [Gaiellales bacterium]